MDKPSVTPTSLQTQTETITVSMLTVVIAAVILVLIGLAVVVIRYMFRHKGSYRTNEAKGMEFAETADTALRGDPALRDAMDISKKEYFI
ncbi:glycophorin-C-like isoform X2 [Thunnus thynnus]|uniref:glycophorin-C-like isoform X2 n=1 Tax=Thunnus thynnus TaxID=8237 RepID=UPI003527FFA4